MMSNVTGIRHCYRGFSSRYASPTGDLMHPSSFNPGMEVYNPGVRPYQGQGPVRVTVNVYVRAVEDIDPVKNTIKLQITLRNSTYMTSIVRWGGGTPKAD